MAASSRRRASGVLLHITSLPSAFGIGDLGPESYRFVDMLADQKQHYWSILPLSPTRHSDGDSPYQTNSAFAGNPLLISPEKLAADGLLPKQTPLKPQAVSQSKVDFKEIYFRKAAILLEAYANYKKFKPQADEFEAFCSQNKVWLDDYALYSAFRQKTGKPWYEWLPSIRRREPKTIARKQQLHAEEVEREKFGQYLFFSQWRSLKEYCQKKQICIIGDMPFYVAHDSADIWVHPDLFSLYGNGKPRYVGGVPPDYFSTTGQLWGNPTYNWQRLEASGFEWWLDRIRHNLMLCDKLRLDHFRGFIAYWQVSALAKTAIRGKWVKTPSEAFLKKLRTAFASLPFIAEDLGYIDKPVEEAIQHLGIPGMRVLLFGLDGSKDNPHALSNHVENSVVYTGTHDTNTVRGWFSAEASVREKANLLGLVGKEVGVDEVSFEVVKLAMSSVAGLCLVPLQDVLGLGSEARMNNPSKSVGNWQWRVTPKQLSNPNLVKLGDLTANYLRC